MSGHPDDALPLHAQIANAEFRLAALRARRETFMKQGRVLKYGFSTTLALAALLFPFLALTTQADPVPALFIGTIFLGAGAVIAWVYRNENWITDPSRRFPGFNRYTSHGVFLDEAIKENERRLAELGAKT